MVRVGHGFRMEIFGWDRAVKRKIFLKEKPDIAARIETRDAGKDEWCRWLYQARDGTECGRRM